MADFADLARLAKISTFATVMIMDMKYMRRALQLARLGEFGASPNPMVGAVIVMTLPVGSQARDFTDAAEKGTPRSMPWLMPTDAVCRWTIRPFM